MSKLLSTMIAAAFAVTTLTAVAQTTPATPRRGESGCGKSHACDTCRAGESRCDKAKGKAKAKDDSKAKGEARPKAKARRRTSKKTPSKRRQAEKRRGFPAFFISVSGFAGMPTL